MSMRSLAAFAMNQTVIWKRRIGTTNYGQDQYASSEPIRCRVSLKRRLVVSDQGEEIASGALVTTLDPVDMGDIITIDGRNYNVLEVQRPVDLDGVETRRKVYL